MASRGLKPAARGVVISRGLKLPARGATHKGWRYICLRRVLFPYALLAGKMTRMIVTIDGAAGSGKSTAARKLAARLGIAYLDTGAMYRAVALAAQERGVDLGCDEALLELAQTIELEVDCGPTHTRVQLDGRDVSEAIRTMSVSALTPYVARHQGIRELLVRRQQSIGRALGSLVAEGRDQGGVVFPDADAKFVLEASLDKRAERRLRELQGDGEEVEVAEVMKNLVARDAVDAQQWEPLLASGQAIVIDTSDLTIGEVVDRLAASLPGGGSSLT